MSKNPATDPELGIGSSPGLVAVTFDTPFATPVRGLYLDETGDIAVTCLDGSTRTLVGMAAGVFHKGLMITQVNTTGTSIAASAICGIR